MTASAPSQPANQPAPVGGRDGGVGHAHGGKIKDGKFSFTSSLGKKKVEITARREQKGAAPSKEFAAAALFLIWWSLTTGLGSVVQSLQPKTVAASVPDPQPVPVPPMQATAEPVLARAPQPPVYREPTAAEIAEWQRQSEESMRVLERTTPEVPLALPNSPAVGPAAP